MMCPNSIRTPLHWEFGEFTADTLQCPCWWSLEKLAATGNHPAASLVVIPAKAILNDHFYIYF